MLNAPGCSSECLRVCRLDGLDQLRSHGEGCIVLYEKVDRRGAIQQPGCEHTRVERITAFSQSADVMSFLSNVMREWSSA